MNAAFGPLGSSAGTATDNSGQYGQLGTDHLIALHHSTGATNDSDDDSSELDYISSVAGGGHTQSLERGGTGMIARPMGDPIGAEEDAAIAKASASNSESTWSHDETLALMAAVQENYESIIKKKRNKVATVWLPAIASRLQQQGFTKTAEQCHVKWKNLLHKYRDLKEQSVRNRGRLMDPPRLWTYYKMMEDIVGKSSQATENSLSVSHFVMCMPPAQTPAPSWHTSQGNAMRPYSDMVSTLQMSYYQPLNTAGLSSQQTMSSTENVVGGGGGDQLVGANGRRNLDDRSAFPLGSASTEGLLADKLDKVIYLLERQIELQEKMAGITATGTPTNIN